MIWIDSTGLNDVAAKVAASLLPCLIAPGWQTSHHQDRRPSPDGYDAFALLVTLEAGVDKATEADQELLACCREAKAANHEAAAVMNGIEALDDDATVMPALEAATPLFVAYSDAILRAGYLPARTPEGLRAKAALLLLHLTTEDDPVALAASLARDVAGRR